MCVPRARGRAFQGFDPRAGLTDSPPATEQASGDVTLVVRDSVAAANGRDLPKYLDAAKVRTMTVGRSADRGKPLLRQGQTHERGTRKAKIEAKLERRRTMADQDLRR